MNWNKLKNKECPKCNSILLFKEKELKCSLCNFRIRIKKFEDLIKGKDSSSYKRKVDKFRKIIKFKNKSEDYDSLQLKEREYNLRKIQRKNASI